MSEELTTEKIETTEAADAAVEPSASNTDEETILGKSGAEASAEQAGPPESYVLDLPEGMELNAEALEVATPIFQELKLSNEAVNKLVPAAITLVESTSKRIMDQITSDVLAQRKAWADEVLADPEIGGANLEKTQAIAARALDALAPPEFRSFLNETGLGNHPAMVRFVYNVGKAISEDGFGRETVQTGAPPVSPADWYDEAYRGRKE